MTAMRWLQCNDCNARNQCYAFNPMQSMLYNQWDAINAVQSMLCNQWYAINAVQSMLCNQCNGINAMRSMKYNLMKCNEYNACYEINVMLACSYQ